MTEEHDTDTGAENEDVSAFPDEAADPHHLVESKIPEDIRDRYEIYSYRNAAIILAESRTEEFNDLLTALRKFSITTKMIRTAGGNESEIPKIISKTLRPLGWHETTIQGDLIVRLLWKEQVGNTRAGRPRHKSMTKKMLRKNYLDGHKVDYVKGKVAFDLEWNSKDQTFDRDLYAFNAFSQTGAIDVAVLLTRSASLNPVFRSLGEALDRNGNIDLKRNGEARMTYVKYGASTTWMGKLLYRLNAGRNGGCPVLAIGITPKCIEDYEP